MEALIWTTTIWGAAVALIQSLRHRYSQLNGLINKETLALLIALLGTYSIVINSEVDAILREPVVMERVMRGGLSALALAMTLPTFIARLHGPRLSNPTLFGLAVYMGIALVTALYSAASLVSAAKVFELTAAIVPIAAVALGPDPRRRLRRMLSVVVAFQAILLLVAVAGFFMMPDTFAVMESRPGFLVTESLFAPWAHSNTIAAMGAIVAAFGVAKYLSPSRGARLWMGAAMVGLTAIILSSGRQGVVMAVAGLAVVLFFQRRRAFMWFLAPAIASIVVTFWDSIFSSLARDRPDALTNLSGRLFWWEAALDVWTAHAWTGWGYAAGGRFVALRSIGRGGTTSIHSGYIEALVGVGIIGMIPLLYVMGKVIAWSWRSLVRQRDVAYAVLIVPLVIRTTVSMGFAGWLDPAFVMFALLAAITDKGLSPVRGSPVQRQPGVKVG